MPISRQDEFIERLHEAVQDLFYVNGELNRSAFGKIVDERNLRRLAGYLEDARSKGAKVAFGGAIDNADRTVHPTALYDVPADAQVLREEIFGPILPIVAYDRVEDVCASIQKGGKPLALYVFSGDGSFTEKILANTSSGGVTINGWALHWFEPQLPFGGVNESGMADIMVFMDSASFRTSDRCSPSAT